MEDRFQTILINSRKALQSLEQINQILEEILINRAQADSFNSRFINGMDKNTIGIKDLSELNEWAYTKGEELKYLIITPVEKLSEEAQNSLLKLIEEPPRLFQVVLITHNSDLVLKTILSRALVLTNEKIGDEIIKNEIEELAEEFLSKNFLERKDLIETKLLNDSFNRYDLSLFLEKLMELLLKKDSNNSKVFRAIKKAHFVIKREVNVKLALTYLNIAFESLIS